jgi:ApbE superfamily uncharacterized protein (UPF0280 family)
MFHIKKKIKTPLLPDENRMRSIIQEELNIHDTTIQIRNDKEKERQIKLSRIRSLPKSKRRQLERYLRERRGRNEKR